MVTRMVLGEVDGTMQFRISPPGYDAMDKTQPAVFDSNNDYLKLHAVLSGTLTESGGYYGGEFTFTDLGYIPLTFISIGSTSLKRVFYPNDRNPATSQMNNNTNAH